MLHRILIGTLLLVALGVSPGYARTHVVMQNNKTFSPSELTIRVGDTIVFMNDDRVSHNIFSASEGFRFNLSVISPKKSRSYRFDAVGTAEIRCAFHPRMKIKVVVER